jgi:hypothetical protein
VFLTWSYQTSKDLEVKMLRVFCFFAICCSVVCSIVTAEEYFAFDLGDKMFSKLSDKEKSILSDYAKVYPRIKNYYENMRMDVVEKVYRYPQDGDNNATTTEVTPVLMSETEYEIRYRTDLQSGFFRRVDSITRFVLPREADTDLDKKNKERFVSHHIALISPRKAYELVKPTAATYFNVTHTRDVKKGEETDGFIVLKFDNAPCAGGSKLLEELLFQPPHTVSKKNYFINSVKQLDVNGNNLVEIVSGHDDNDSQWVVRLSMPSWVVADVTYTSSRVGSYTKTTCTYQDRKPDGLPVLKHCKIEGGRISNNNRNRVQIISERQCEVTRFVPGPPPLSEFDVNQILPYGTKIGVGTVVFTLTRIVCIVAGLILFFIGVYMKVRLANKK